MPDTRQADYARQSSLIQALLETLRKQSSGRGVKLIETHISWVLLAGKYAYKIKKSVDFGFLNFTSLEARLYYCEEEIRLNRRLAPAIYLDVIAIGGSEASPVPGAQPALEYAVRMRRFAVSKQLDRLVIAKKILPRHIDSLAAIIARFHGGLPAADMSSLFATPNAIYQATEQNFVQLQGLLKGSDDTQKLADLRLSSEREFEACRSLFIQRLQQGFVRECHGDLHLGNIVLIADEPVPFDGIEFNPDLRWIDVMSEIAFTVMDLLHFQRADLAWRFLNAWLEVTGDYAGMRLLRFYSAYRAMVRAKVAAIRVNQAGISPVDSAQATTACRGYLELATNCFAVKQAALIITHGLPGSGKSTFAQMAQEELQAIRLRSDVERKRLFGLGALADSRANGIDLYTPEVSRRVYAHLLALARELLQSGYKVIVDAAFLGRAERAQFHRLAHELSLPFVVAVMQASTETLRERVLLRQRASNDASEADIAVLEKLISVHDPLTAEEKNYSAHFIQERADIAGDTVGWHRLHQLLGYE